MSCLDEDLITVLIRAALYRLNALTLRSDQKETSPSNIIRFLSKKSEEKNNFYQLRVFV